MQLDSKVAIITGGGTGIGAGIARRFAEEGAHVIITGRREQPLHETSAIIAGVKPVYPYALDITDRAQVQRCVEWVKQTYGRIDILVNNAGANVRARRVVDLSPEDWDALIEINATGAFNLIHAVLPVMRAQHDGLIISITSTSGVRPSVLGGAAYSAAKHAMGALTRVVGLEEKTNGIRTTVIAPGEVDTPILLQRPTPVSEEHRSHMLQPEDVAAAALFVAALPPRACVPELIITPAIQDFV